jgi:hypothetical protein
MVVVLTGAVPVRAPLPVFLALFLPAFLLQALALRALGRGLAPSATSIVFDLVRMPANLLATTRLVSRRSRGFTVTAKGRTGGTRSRTRLPSLHVVLIGASAGSAGWFLATTAGLTPVTYAVPWAANGAAVWLAVNSVLLVLASRRITQQRYGAERRNAVRFPVAGTAQVGGDLARLLDASLTGFRVVLPPGRGPQPGEATRVSLRWGGEPIEVDCIARSRWSRGGPLGEEQVVGIEVLPGQRHQQARLSLAVFTGGTPSPATPLPAAAPDRTPQEEVAAAWVPSQRARPVAPVAAPAAARPA